METTQTSIHEPHYDVVAAAVAGTAATVLTLLAMLGGSGVSTTMQVMLYDAQLWVIESALVIGIAGLIIRSQSKKRLLSHTAMCVFIAGTLLVAYSATLAV